MTDRQQQPAAGAAGPAEEPENVAEAAAEVVATMARLGLAVAQLPVALLPPEYRDEVRQSTRDLVQAASYFPRAMSKMLSDFARDLDQARARDAGRREDLGSRLRQEARAAEREARRARRRTQAAAREEGDEAAARASAATVDEAAVDEVTEDVQDAFE